MTINSTFPLGSLVATQNALDRISMSEIEAALQRHGMRDWGDLDDDDKCLNDLSVETEGRVLSAHLSCDGVRFWIITEWDRSATTILLPSDY